MNSLCLLFNYLKIERGKLTAIIGESGSGESTIASLLQGVYPLNEAEIDVFTEEVSGILKNGGSVSTPLFKAKCSIAGGVYGPDDLFYRNRHQVRVTLRP